MKDFIRAETESVMNAVGSTELDREGVRLLLLVLISYFGDLVEAS